jgi:tripartite-type tricarboxylate transporter receptor subunit TctC
MRRSSRASELIEYGKANPKLANYASSATPFQLAAELFNQSTGSSFQHIPYAAAAMPCRPSCRVRC